MERGPARTCVVVAFGAALKLTLEDFDPAVLRWLVASLDRAHAVAVCANGFAHGELLTILLQGWLPHACAFYFLRPFLGGQDRLAARDTA